MPLFASLRSFGRNLLRRETVERDLTAELRAYIDLLTAENIQRGIKPEAARRAALITAGGEEQLKEQVRDARTGAFFETLLRDLRYGTRMLARAPGFTAVAILTLALGIGANTALFTVVNGVLLKPLPYPHPGQLYAMHASKPNFPTGSISYPNFLDWQGRNRTFSAMALSRGTGGNLVVNGEPERVRGEWITADYFTLLGVQPVLGRNFAPGEDAIGGPLQAQISEQLWKRKFGGSPDVIGKAINLDGRSFTVIGVIPASFDLLQVNLAPPDFYLPLGQLRTPALKFRGAGLGLHGIARLKPGVTIEQARSDMERVTRELAAEYPDHNRGVGATLVSLEEAVVGEFRPVLLFLLAAVGFVLLIACVNVASLLLARSASRAREFAVRAALGASRRRMVRQLLTETVLLGIAGGGLGLAVATWGTRAALALLPQALPRTDAVRVDGQVLFFTLAISIFAGVLFGLAPAFRMASPDLRTALSAGRGSGARRLRTHRALVVVEVALALLLLSGAGLMLRSLARLWQVDPGFNSHNLLLFTVDLPPAMRDAKPAALHAMWRQIQTTVSNTPGVAAASLRDGSTPLAGDDELLFWHIGQPEPPSASEKNWALRYDVQPDYLRVMGIPLLRGRFFEPRESHASPAVIVVDDVFAATYFPNQDPIGKRIQWRGSEAEGVIQAEIVGIVQHVKHWGIEDDDTQQLRAQAYRNIDQMIDDEFGFGSGLSVRIDRPQTAVIEQLRNNLRQLNGELVVYGFRSMDDLIAQSLRGRRFTIILLGSFAAAALLLAAVGIYGVISYLVRERTQEIGVRMALGAHRGMVLRMVLLEGVRLAGAGLAIGLLAAIPSARAIRSLLYGVRPSDPLTYVAVAVVLFAVAMLASFVPAHRATRIDPMQALRCD